MKFKITFIVCGMIGDNVMLASDDSVVSEQISTVNMGKKTGFGNEKKEQNGLLAECAISAWQSVIVKREDVLQESGNIRDSDRNTDRHQVAKHTTILLSNGPVSVDQVCNDVTISRKSSHVSEDSGVPLQRKETLPYMEQQKKDTVGQEVFVDERKELVFLQGAAQNRVMDLDSDDEFDYYQQHGHVPSSKQELQRHKELKIVEKRQLLGVEKIDTQHDH